MTELEREFHLEMLNIYKEADRQLNYRPTRFLSMVNKYTGVQTAIKLATNPEGAEGFLKLMEHKRPDLTAEFLVLKEKYRSLFSEEVIEKCQERLDSYKSFL